MFAAASDELAGHHACSCSMFGDAQCWRDYLWPFRRLKISNLAEFATNEVVGMKEELVWRCSSLTHQQAMQVCVAPVRTCLDFANRRPLPREDRESTLSNLSTVAERLTSLLQNYRCSFLVVCLVWIHVGVPY